ncbi:MAG: septum formation protein Maf [Gemmatimonadetes bacterium]|nr:septum formation protein Maf [Gemmatimonadota bacterium]
MSDRLILASASPRRADLLTQVGIRFRAVPANTREPRADEGEPPEQFAIRAALVKALDVAERERGICLGADTIVVVGDRIFGKPRDDEDARAMLGDLSGRWHRVITGMALALLEQESVPQGWSEKEGCWTTVETTRVRFRELDRGEIARYIATGEPMGKAGAYAIQGVGAGLVDSIEGSYTNVVGLPVARLIEGLRDRVVWPGRRY